MKTKFRTVVLVMVLAMMAQSSEAQPQVTPDNVTLVTPLPPIIVGGTVSNASTVIQIPKTGGAALSIKFNASGGTAAGYIWLYTTVDTSGTNYSTAPFAMLTLTPATTTDQVFNTNWSEAALSGYRGFKLSWSNSAAGSVNMTNKGVWIGRSQ